MIRHISYGGMDQRVETAKSFASQGVILARSVDVARGLYRRGGLRPKTALRNKILRDYKAEHKHLSKLAVRDAVAKARSVSTFSQEEVQGAQRACAISQLHRMRKRTSLTTEDNFTPSHDLGLSTFLEPLSAEKFVATVASHSPGDLDDTAGFRRWGPHARSRMQAKAFVKDVGAIPAKKKFLIRQCCGQSHRGVCRTTDSEHIESYLACGRRLHDYVVANKMERRWLRLGVEPNASVGAESPLVDMFVYVAYVQRTHPPTALFLQGYYISAKCWD